MTRYEILHNYLLKKNNVAFKYKKAKYEKLETFTLILVPFRSCNKHLQHTELGYNYVPFNTIKTYVQHPLQCHDKTNKV